MIKFFSIAIRHDFDSNDSEIDFSNDLTIVPANTNKEFVKNNRLFFRNQLGSIDCYIEDEEEIKEEVEILFFWVVCNNANFFNYTAYPIDANFSTPNYYWSNSKESDDLQEQVFRNIPLETPPNKAIGSIGIIVNKVSSNKRFTINFKVKKTIWVYHIHLKQSQKEWTYKITDKKNEWVFTEILKNEESIVFESKDIIPFFKFATDRLMLSWTNNQPISFENEQTMVLPYPNYAYKMVNEDNKELTPVYIYI